MIVFAAGGHAQGDAGSGFENITGSSFADSLVGNSADNVLIGLAGDDSLTGGAGADTLNGGSGTFDTVHYTDSPAGVTVTLGASGAATLASGGDAEGDLISNVENISGSSFDDQLMIRVADDGVGFDPPQLPHDFSPEGGFGLLSAEAQMEAMGGRLRIESAPGRGTEATLALPLPLAGA